MYGSAGSGGFLSLPNDDPLKFWRYLANGFIQRLRVPDHVGRNGQHSHP